MDDDTARVFYEPAYRRASAECGGRRGHVHPVEVVADERAGGEGAAVLLQQAGTALLGGAADLVPCAVLVEGRHRRRPVHACVENVDRPGDEGEAGLQVAGLESAQAHRAFRFIASRPPWSWRGAGRS